MASLLGQLADQYELVLIDTAPLLVISDAFALLQQASGLIGVARLEQTPGNVVARMIEVTQTAGGRLLGMVATGARADHGYGYGYGYATDTGTRGLRPARATVQRSNGAGPGQGGDSSPSSP